MITSHAERRDEALERSSDAHLVSQCLAGDEQAFALVMRRNNQRLFRVARSILRNDADAEDAVQETYLRAYMHLGSFQGRSALSTWLIRLTVNESLGRIRSQRRRKQEPLGDFDEWSVNNVWSKVVAMSLSENQPERSRERDELRNILEQAIDRLPEKFRPAFVLREIEGLSGKEVAESLDIPEATVKTRCFRARRLLQKELHDRLQDQLPRTFVFLGVRCDRLVATVLGRIRERGNMDP